MNLKQKIYRIFSRSKLYLKRSSPTILCLVASAGVVGTAIVSSRTTTKVKKLLDDAENEKGEELSKLEIAMTVIPSCIPAAAIGVGTIFCIFGVNSLNKNQQATLVSAYTLVNSTYQEYKNKIKELYGEEVHQKVIDAIALDHCEDVCICGGTFFGGSSLSVDEDPESTRLFYDFYSKRYFESTLAKVIQAEYHLNRNFTMRGESPVNEFYEFLGLELIEYGDVLGWDMCGGIQWIDFNHRITKLETGLECCVIEMAFDPYPSRDGCIIDMTYEEEEF